MCRNNHNDLQKQIIRREMLQALRQMDADERSQQVAEISAGLQSLPEWRRAGNILGYAPLPEEFPLLPLLKIAHAQGKRVFLPRIDRQIDGRLGEQIDGRQARIDRQIDGRQDEQIDGGQDEQIDGRLARIDRQINGRQDGQIDGGLDEQIDGGLGEQIHTQRMAFLLWEDLDPRGLEPGAFGLRVPGSSAPAWEPAETESSMVIVPGLAFCSGGGRLGRGGGFYDRFLAAHGGLYSVALCFRVQLRGWLPLSEQDLAVKRVIVPA